jgi:hypothetical protein
MLGHHRGVWSDRGESFKKHVGESTFRKRSVPSRETSNGWRFSFEDADGRDFIYPVNPPLRYNACKILGRGYQYSARDSLKWNRQVRFLLSAIDYDRLDPLIRDAL